MTENLGLRHKYRYTVAEAQRPTVDDLSDLLASTRCAILWLDEGLCVRHFTPACAALLAMEPAPSLQPMREVHWRFDPGGLLEDARRALLEAAASDAVIQTDAGRWYLRRVTPFRPTDGRAEGVVINFIDITAEREAQIALQARERTLSGIIDAVPVLISYVDRDGRYQFNNAGYETWFGVGHEDLRGRHLREVLGEAGYRIIRPYLDKVLRNEPVSFEGYLPDAHAGTRYVRVDYMPDTDTAGTVIGFFALITDLSDRRRTEDEIERLNRDLRRQLRETQAILEAAPIGIYVAHDPECRQITMNAVGAAMLHLSSDANPSPSSAAAAALPFRIFKGGHAIPPDELPMQKAAAHDRTVNAEELQVVYRDGTSITTVGNAAPLHDEQGCVCGCVGTFVDVTEQERLDQELREQAQQLAEADRRKNEFLATLGHELRNPLAPIRNAVTTLDLRERTPESVDQAVKVIARQTEHLIRLADDLLDVARISRGAIQLQHAPVELAHVVDDAVQATRSLIVRKHLQLDVRLPDEPIVLSGDATRLTQVVTNLVNNAAKYTPQGGHIAVRAWPEEGRLVLEVSDDGMGIDAADLPCLFETFGQCQRSLGQAEGGLGLGLALVRKLVELHGGTIEAHSDGPNRGSRFTVRIPITAAASTEVEQQAPPAARSAAGAPKRILIVDDQKDVADSFELLIAALGHSVRCVYDGAQALDAVREFEPDLVLLDLSLPGMDGWEVARRLHATPKRRAIKLVAMSGFGQEDNLARARQSGFDDYLLKPIDLKRLDMLLSRS